LFRIAQEAVTNARKHARALIVEIDLEVRSDQVILAVSDHGAGIPSATANGFGMKLMRYRANVLQGELLVHKRFPKGTTITCVCPNRMPGTTLGGN
jgi:signal transduction histidine kinase